MRRGQICRFCCGPANALEIGRGHKELVRAPPSPALAWMALFGRKPSATRLPPRHSRTGSDAGTRLASTSKDHRAKVGVGSFSCPAG